MIATDTISERSERPAPAALEQLAPGDEPDRASAAHDRTTSMNSSDSVGGWKEKRRTVAGGGRRGEDGGQVEIGRDEEPGEVAAPLDDGQVRPAASQALPLPATSTSRWRRADAARRSSIAPAAAIRPRLMITTSSQSPRRGRAGGSRRRRATPAAARSRRIVRHRRDPERVEAAERLVEDEQLRVVDERRPELDPLLVAVGQRLELRPRPVAETEAVEPARGRRLRVGRAGRPCCWAK